MTKKYKGLTEPAEIRKHGITSVGVLAGDFIMELSRKKEALEAWQALGVNSLVCGKHCQCPPLVPEIRNGEVILVCSCGHTLKESEISPQFVKRGSEIMGA